MPIPHEIHPTQSLRKPPLGLLTRYCRGESRTLRVWMECPALGLFGTQRDAVADVPGQNPRLHLDGAWCSQWFGAIGKAPAKCIICKNWNRHALSDKQK